MKVSQCPCHSGKAFARCCGPFLSGRDKPRTVTQLMRSRYCAFALGGCGEYLLATWHSGERTGLDVSDLDGRHVEWIDLEVLRSTQDGDRGTVEFVARFRQENGSEGSHHELSSFVRERGRWYYVSGLLR